MDGVSILLERNCMRWFSLPVLHGASRLGSVALSSSASHGADAKILRRSFGRPLRLDRSGRALRHGDREGTDVLCLRVRADLAHRCTHPRQLKTLGEPLGRVVLLGGMRLSRGYSLSLLGGHWLTARRGSSSRCRLIGGACPRLSSRCRQCALGGGRGPGTEDRGRLEVDRCCGRRAIEVRWRHSRCDGPGAAPGAHIGYRDESDGLPAGLRRRRCTHDCHCADHRGRLGLEIVSFKFGFTAELLHCGGLQCGSECGGIDCSIDTASHRHDGDCRGGLHDKRLVAETVDTVGAGVGSRKANDEAYL